MTQNPLVETSSYANLCRLLGQASCDVLDLRRIDHARLTCVIVPERTVRRDGDNFLFAYYASKLAMSGMERDTNST